MTYTEKAKKMRPYIVQAANALDDKTVSLAPELLGTLTGDGSLVKSGTRINWHGKIKKAAVDLWDTAQNTPDEAPDLWSDLGGRSPHGERGLKSRRIPHHPDGIYGGACFLRGRNRMVGAGRMLLHGERERHGLDSFGIPQRVDVEVAV